MNADRRSLAVVALARRVEMTREHVRLPESGATQDRGQAAARRGWMVHGVQRGSAAVATSSAQHPATDP